MSEAKTEKTALDRLRESQMAWEVRCPFDAKSLWRVVTQKTRLIGEVDRTVTTSNWYGSEEEARDYATWAWGNGYVILSIKEFVRADSHPGLMEAAKAAVNAINESWPLDNKSGELLSQARNQLTAALAGEE